MAVFTKELCQSKLKLWLDAEEAVALGQSYRIANRELTRADLQQVRIQIEYWAQKLTEIENAEKRKGRNRVYRALIRDI